MRSANDRDILFFGNNSRVKGQSFYLFTVHKHNIHYMNLKKTVFKDLLWSWSNEVFNATSHRFFGLMLLVPRFGTRGQWDPYATRVMGVKMLEKFYYLTDSSQPSVTFKKVTLLHLKKTFDHLIKRWFIGKKKSEVRIKRNRILNHVPPPFHGLLIVLYVFPLGVQAIFLKSKIDHYLLKRYFWRPSRS